MGPKRPGGRLSASMNRRASIVVIACLACNAELATDADFDLEGPPDFGPTDMLKKLTTKQ